MQRHQNQGLDHQDPLGVLGCFIDEFAGCGEFNERRSFFTDSFLSVVERAKEYFGEVCARFKCLFADFLSHDFHDCPNEVDF